MAVLALVVMLGIVPALVMVLAPVLALVRVAVILRMPKQLTCTW